MCLVVVQWTLYTFYSYEHIQRTKRSNLGINEVTTYALTLIDEHIAYHLKNNVIKSYKLKNIRALESSREFNTHKHVKKTKGIFRMQEFHRN
jgi:hypothetical protein